MGTAPMAIIKRQGHLSAQGCTANGRPPATLSLGGGPTRKYGAGRIELLDGFAQLCSGVQRHGVGCGIDVTNIA